MSGIVNKVIKRKTDVAVIFMLMVLTAFFLFFRMYLAVLVILVFAALNEITVGKMNKQKIPFGTYSKIRNVDCLVIGDINPNSMHSLSESSNIVSIFLPGCTLAGAFEVLRHTFSILKECGGTVILAVRKKNIGKAGYSPFDISFFHRITINRLGIKNAKLMRRFPVLFAPLKSMMFLGKIGKSRSMKDYFDKEVLDFCSKRGIEMRILEV